MICPCEKKGETSVVDSRPTEDGTAIRRRRLCSCGERFTTFERIQYRELMVVKKNGRKSAFDRDKLAKSIYIALKKRPLDTETVEKFISRISRSLEELGQSEISSNTIGTMVMEGLKELDPVAYVRFASVYRNFREEKDFVQFVDKIDVFKKDKFTLKDKNYMKLAINLARARKGLTGENPSVGCVLVKNDRIISIGQTGYRGRPHAETNAIKNSLENLNGTKMYVTLEPCNHYGKTPPCTNRIIKSGIKEVFYSINDIDKKVRGKSYEILNKQNIKVNVGILKDEAKELYESYIINRKYNLPYVTAKIAISKNNLIYSEGTKRITNQLSDKLSHYLRFKNDAIMISSKTLNIDNSKLNCRLKGYENFSPKRIILDRNLDINLNTYVFKTAKKFETIIFHNSVNKSKITTLKKIKLTF